MVGHLASPGRLVGYAAMLRTESAPARATRIDLVSGGESDIEQAIRRMIRLCQHGLPLMLHEDRRHFGFTRRRGPGGRIGLEGLSLRYSAIALLGIMHLQSDSQREILSGQTAGEFFSGMIDESGTIENLGDAALMVWAAAQLHHPALAGTLQNLRRLSSGANNFFTVELSWALAALTAARDQSEVQDETAHLRDHLLSIFNHETGLFPHEFAGRWYRSHVGCFADQIYPIQSLALYHKAYGDAAALSAANRCADQICNRQGPDGQWWWHYDVRTGNVIEGYPVYSVHQHAMAPMALLDLFDAGGDCHVRSIRDGIRWMIRAAEVGSSLIDDENYLIWRKVGRKEPGKITRTARAIVCRFFKSGRLRWLDRVFPANTVDFECRPYELGWLLHVWLGAAEWETQSKQ